jgi:hypothetical protein
MSLSFNSDYHISIWRPKGVTTLTEIVLLLNEFVKMEREKPAFNRYTDISEADLNSLKFEEMHQIFMLREMAYKGPIIKNAFYVNSSLQYGLARTYQTLMSDTPIKVEIFKTREECAIHLNVPLEILLPTSK